MRVMNLNALLLALSMTAVSPGVVIAQGWEVLAVESAKFIGGYLGGKTLDEMFNADGSAKVDAIDARLRIAEEQLSSMGSEHAYQLRRLRDELTAKTSKERVRIVVEEALSDLRYQIDAEISSVNSRVSRIDERANSILHSVRSRTETLEQRQKRLKIEFAEHREKMEECFGYLPRIPPSINPTSFDSAFVARPIVEPLLVLYVQLLVRSELGRVQHFRDQQLYLPGSTTFAKFVVKQDEIGKQIYDLQAAAKSNLAITRLQRQELSQQYASKNPKLRDADLRISGATWLVGATTPVLTDLGVRLPLPKRLFSDGGSEILASLSLAGGDPASLAPLFVQDLKGSTIPEIAYTELSGERPLSKFSAARNLQIGNSNHLLMKCWRLAVEMWLLEQKHLSDTKHHGELSEKIKFNRAQKASYLARARNFSSSIESQLELCTKGYLRMLTEEKSTYPAQSRFRTGVLTRLASASQAFDCLDWESPTALEVTWRSLVKAADSRLVSETKKDARLNLPWLDPVRLKQVFRVNGDRISLHFRDRQFETKLTVAEIQDVYFSDSMIVVLTDFGQVHCFNHEGQYWFYRSPAQSIRIAVSDSARLLATCDASGSIRICSLRNGDELFSVGNFPNGIIEFKESESDRATLIVWQRKLGNNYQQTTAFNCSALVTAKKLKR